MSDLQFYSTYSNQPYEKSLFPPPFQVSSFLHFLERSDLLDIFFNWCSTLPQLTALYFTADESCIMIKKNKKAR